MITHNGKEVKDAKLELILAERRQQHTWSMIRQYIDELTKVVEETNQ